MGLSAPHTHGDSRPIIDLSFNMAQKVANLGNRAFLLGKNIAIAGTPKLKTAWKYAKVELRPPTFSEVVAAQTGLQKVVKSGLTGGYRNITLKEAGLNVIVAAEIYFWFIIGECLGKRSLVGYDIPGATDWEIHF